jgi:hypothetical protein
MILHWLTDCCLLHGYRRGSLLNILKVIRNKQTNKRISNSSIFAIIIIIIIIINKTLFTLNFKIAITEMFPRNHGNWSRIPWEPRSTRWNRCTIHFHTQCENLRSSRATTTKQKLRRTFPKVSYRRKVSTADLSHLVTHFFPLSLAPWRFMSNVTGQTKQVTQVSSLNFKSC